MGASVLYSVNITRYHQRIKCVDLIALFPALNQYLKVQTFFLLCLFSLSSSALMHLEVNLSAPLGCELSFSASENSSFQHFLPASQQCAQAWPSCPSSQHTLAPFY